MVYGQDPYFSGLGTSLYNNPAASLINLDGDEETKGSLSTTYRDQWSKVSNNAYKTTNLEGNLRIYESTLDCWNIGMVLLNDRSINALLKTNTILLTTAYTRKFASSRSRSNIITVGSSVGYHSSNINLNDLWFGRQYDLSIFEVSENMSNGETTILDNRSYFSLNVGGRWIANLDSKNKVSLSVAVHQLNRPTIGFNEENNSLSSRVVAIGSYRSTLTRFLSQELGLSYTHQLNSYQLNPYYQVIYALPDNDDISLLLSLSGRIANSINGVLLDAVIPAIGIESNTWQARISYDVNVSSLRMTTPNAGALELTLGYYLKT